MAKIPPVLMADPTAEPRAANWPARTWRPAELVTSGMMNGVRDQLNELHGQVDGIVAGTGGGNIAYKDKANVFTLQGNTFPSLTVGSGVASTTLRPAYDSTADMVDLTSADQSRWGKLRASYFYSTGVSNSFGDLTVRGATNFQSGVAISAGNLTVAGTSTVTGTTTFGGFVVSRMTISGGADGAYYSAPIEIQMPANPRIGFHWPGVVASQLGMDSSGRIRTYDNPGSGYAVLQGILQPRIASLGAGAQGYQIDCNLVDMVTHDAIYTGSMSWFQPLNPRDGMAIIIRMRDQGGAVTIYWDGHFVTGCAQALPGATVGGAKNMWMAFRYSSYVDRWYMLALSVEP